MNDVYLKWDKKKMGREEMLISDFGSDEEGTAGKSQDAKVGHKMV